MCGFTFPSLCLVKLRFSERKWLQYRSIDSDVIRTKMLTCHFNNTVVLVQRMRLRLLCEWIQFGAHLGAFYFGSSLIVALVKRPPFYFFQMFPNFCVQVYSFGFAFRFRLRV